MKNILEKKDNLHGEVNINKLFWIGMQTQNSDLIELIKELDDEQLEELFPEVQKAFIADRKKGFDPYDGNEELMQYFTSRNILGLVAELHIMSLENFRYNEKGQVEGYSSSGYWRTAYVYAENMQHLFHKIKLKNLELFQEFQDYDSAKAINKFVEQNNS